MTLGPSQPPTPSCRGGARHFHLGGPLERPVFQQGELSMVYVGLSEEDLRNFGGPLGGSGPPGTPLAPPLPSCILYIDVLGSHCSSSL